MDIFVKFKLYDYGNFALDKSITFKDFGVLHCIFLEER